MVSTTPVEARTADPYRNAVVVGHCSMFVDWLLKSKKLGSSHWVSLKKMSEKGRDEAIDLSLDHRFSTLGLDSNNSSAFRAIGSQIS